MLNGITQRIHELPHKPHFLSEEKEGRYNQDDTKEGMSTVL